MGVPGLLCAVQAGCFAALASVCGKLAFSSSVTTKVVEDLSGYVHPAFEFSLVSLSTAQLILATRVFAGTGIIVFNALMWVLFTKSMHLCSSTVEATATTTSSNFLFTAFLGKVLFAEQLGLLWYVGSALIVAGLATLHTSSSESPEAAAVNKTKKL